MKNVLLTFILSICLQNIYSQPTVGQEAPEIKGVKILDKQLPGLNNKFVLIDFWATWCGPCIKSFPHVNELAKKYKDEVVFMAVSDESEEKIRKFIQNNSYDHIYWATDVQLNLNASFSIESIPVYYLISPDNKIVATGLTVELSDTKLDSLISWYKKAVRDHSQVTITQDFINESSFIEIKDVKGPGKQFKENENTLLITDSLKLILPYLEGVQVANRVRFENIPECMIEVKIFSKNTRVDSVLKRTALEKVMEKYHIQRKEIVESTATIQLKVGDYNRLKSDTIINEPGVRQRMEIRDFICLLDNYTISELCVFLEKCYFPKIIYPDTNYTSKHDWDFLLIEAGMEKCIEYDRLKENFKREYDIDFIGQHTNEKIIVYYSSATL